MSQAFAERGFGGGGVQRGRVAEVVQGRFRAAAEEFEAAELDAEGGIVPAEASGPHQMRRRVGTGGEGGGDAEDEMGPGLVWVAGQEALGEPEQGGGVAEGGVDAGEALDDGGLEGVGSGRGSGRAGQGGLERFGGAGQVGALEAGRAEVLEAHDGGVSEGVLGVGRGRVAVALGKEVLGGVRVCGLGWRRSDGWAKDGGGAETGDGVPVRGGNEAVAGEERGGDVHEAGARVEGVVGDAGPGGEEQAVAGWAGAVRP